MLYRALNRFRFSTITHIRGRPETKADDQVELRGIRIASTREDSPNIIFFPEIFDQAENWLQFFTNPLNNIIQHRNVYIIYPRNFGNSDRHPIVTWESMANDVMRFMYTNKISMATLGGHGIGGKIALAPACYNNEKVTGYFGFDTTPTNQYYFEPFHELRDNLHALKEMPLNRGFSAIASDIKSKVKCPKWRSIFESNLTKHENSYTWKFDLDNILYNIKSDQPSSMIGWHPSIGLYPGRVLFTFPDESRYVYLNTNTLPMLRTCPHAKGFLYDIFSVQGDTGVQNHWIYERDDEVNPYAGRLSNFLRHYDGVHTLLVHRDEVNREHVPEIYNNFVSRPVPSDIKPAHYHHNWRFNNIYNTEKK